MSFYSHKQQGTSSAGFVLDCRNGSPSDAQYNETGFCELAVGGSGAEYEIEFVNAADGGAAPTAPTVPFTSGSSRCTTIRSGEKRSFGTLWAQGYDRTVHGPVPLCTHLRVYCVAAGTNGVLTAWGQ